MGKFRMGSWSFGLVLFLVGPIAWGSDERCQGYVSTVQEGISFPLFKSLAYARPAAVVKCVVGVCGAQNPTVELACREVFFDPNGNPVLAPGAGFFAPRVEHLPLRLETAEWQGELGFFRLSHRKQVNPSVIFSTEGNVQVLFDRPRYSSPVWQKMVPRSVFLRLKTQLASRDPFTRDQREELLRTVDPALYEKNFPKIRDHLKLSDRALLLMSMVQIERLESVGEVGVKELLALLAPEPKS